MTGFWSVVTLAHPSQLAEPVALSTAILAMPELQNVYRYLHVLLRGGFGGADLFGDKQLEPGIQARERQVFVYFLLPETNGVRLEAVAARHEQAEAWAALQWCSTLHRRLLRNASPGLRRKAR